MKRNIFVVFIFTLTITFLPLSSAKAQDLRKFVINPVTTNIIGINIASKRNEIIEILGNPKSINNHYSELTDSPTMTFKYKDIEILIINESIYGLKCSSNQCKTNLGIAVGDTKTDVIKIYGNGNPPYDLAGKDSLSYPFIGLDSYLIFHFEDSRVVEIEYFVDFA